jgi:hypothetical protein
MNTGTLFVLAVSILAAMVYVQFRFSNQQWLAKTAMSGKLKNKSSMHRLPETNPEQASHNLEYSDRMQQWDKHRPPIRDTLDADFAAEAHGFTGFEMAGKGSRYKSSDNA